MEGLRQVRKMGLIVASVLGIVLVPNLLYFLDDKTGSLNHGKRENY